jgi:hypothetical protein
LRLNGRELYPDPADRARLTWLDDHTLSSREVALRARCSPATAASVRRELEDYGVLAPQRVPEPRFPRYRGLPPAPRALAEGACVGHERADAWTSAEPADRILAAVTCAGCHVLAACREWSLSLPDADQATYAGWGASDRERERLRRAGRPLPARLTSAGKNAARQRRRAAQAARAQEAS